MYIRSEIRRIILFSYLIPGFSFHAAVPGETRFEPWFNLGFGLLVVPVRAKLDVRTDTAGLAGVFDLVNSLDRFITFDRVGVLDRVDPLDLVGVLDLVDSVDRYALFNRPGVTSLLRDLEFSILCRNPPPLLVGSFRPSLTGVELTTLLFEAGGQG